MTRPPAGVTDDGTLESEAAAFAESEPSSNPKTTETREGLPAANAETDSPTGDPADHSGLVRRGSGARMRRLTLLAIVVALLAAAVLNHLTRQQQAAEDDASEAVRVGTSSVQTLLSYKAVTIDDELRSENSLLTGKFAEGYKKLVDEALAPAAKVSKTSTSAEVRAAAPLGKAMDNTVKVLMFLNVTTTGRTLKTPQVTGSRIVVKMKYVEGKWRIADIDPV